MLDGVVCLKATMYSTNKVLNVNIQIHNYYEINNHTGFVNYND